MARIRTWIKVGGINLAVVAGLLLALEGAVRLFVPAIGPVGTDRGLFADSVFAATPGPRAGASGLSNGARFTVGPHGFWQYAAAVDTTRASWLLLGDSVTMGIGVDPDSTFAGRLAVAADSLNLLNPSLIGYSTRDYRSVFFALTDTLHRPDWRIRRATVFWCLNDVYVPASTDPGAQVRQVGGTLLMFLRQHTRSYTWLKALLFDRPQTYFDHDRRLYDGPPLDAAFADLAAMQARAQAQGIKLEVVLLPYAAQLRPDAPTDAFTPQQILTERLTTLGLPVHNAAPFLVSVPNPEALYLYGDGIHFSTEGHNRIAAFVETRLR